MKKIKLTLAIKFICIVGLLPVCVLGSMSPINNYLVSPAGKYYVGFKDFHWVNADACPDVYYTKENKGDFSQNNKKHCNEMSVRIYYPTHEVGSSLYGPRDDIKQTIKDYSPKGAKINGSAIATLSSYSKKNASIAKGQFPVIIYSSGYGLSPQSYENILLNLVSYGYIVVGINSAFLNGPIKVDNQRSIETILPETDQEKRGLFIVGDQDLDFMLRKIQHKQLNTSLMQSMDIKHIGLLGHSLGAANVAHVAERGHVQAVATLDLAWDNIYPDTCERSVDAPFLEMFSSFIYYDHSTADFPYLCANKKRQPNHTVLILSNKLDPTQKNYSVHAAFTDQGTLRYLPAMQAIMATANANKEKRFSSLGGGWSLINTVNTNLLLFFNHYLVADPQSADRVAWS